MLLRETESAKVHEIRALSYTMRNRSMKKGKVYGEATVSAEMLADMM